MMRRLIKKLFGAGEALPHDNRQQHRQKNSESSPLSIKSPYAAVAIKVDRYNCCAAAQKLQGKRFLKHEAPLLRLPDCANSNCGCRYENYPDRREGPRRELGGKPNLDPDNKLDATKERRAKGGRRAHDLNWAR